MVRLPAGRAGGSSPRQALSETLDQLRAIVGDPSRSDAGAEPVRAGEAGKICGSSGSGSSPAASRSAPKNNAATTSAAISAAALAFPAGPGPVPVSRCRITA